MTFIDFFMFSILLYTSFIVYYDRICFKRNMYFGPEVSPVNSLFFIFLSVCTSMFQNEKSK